MPEPVELAPAWRLFRIIGITGWTVDQIKDTPHRVLEELLMCDEVSQEVAAALAERARERAKNR